MRQFLDFRGQAYHWNVGGQASVELAIFGALFLLLLGVMLNYGLRYNFQQEAQMTAFRRALKIASDPDRGSGSYVMMQDKHIPDPMDLFGVGTKTPIMASAQVVRNYAMHVPPADSASIQGSVMDIQKSKDRNSEVWMRRSYKGAGFRIEYNVPQEALARYSLVYSSVMAKSGTSIDDCSTAAAALPATHPSTWTWVDTSSGSVEKVCNACTTVPVYDGEGNLTGTQDQCDSYTVRALKIIDSCVGETIDYDSCFKQSRMIADSFYCAQQCENNKVPGDTTDCNDVCNRVMNPPYGINTGDPSTGAHSTLEVGTLDFPSMDEANGGAWYVANFDFLPCTNADGQQDRCYEFPVLTGGLFAFAGTMPEGKSLGLQPDTVSRTTRQESINRVERPSTIVTNEFFDWRDETDKSIKTQQGLDTYGYDIPQAGKSAGDYDNVQTEDYQATLAIEGNQTWTTNK